MAQPPWDKGLGEFFILHFTYGMDYDENGVFTPGKIGAWRFDKRSFMAGIPPKNLDPLRVRQRAREAAHRDDERGRGTCPTGRIRWDEARARDDGCFGRGGWRIPAAASARGRSGRGPARADVDDDGQFIGGVVSLVNS